MSDDEGDDINFNELVGNLLSSHNANNEEEENVNNNSNADQDPLIRDTKIEHAGSQNGTELSEFHVEGDDDALAAVVANAIQNMDEEEVPAAGIFGDESIEDTTKEPTDEQQQEEWARILQQGLLQGGETETPGEQTAQQPTEQLDQDDENLRRAILESLQELSVDDTGSGITKARDDTKSKRSSKKSSKKKKDKSKTKDSDKDKHISSKKKKHSKDHKKSSQEKDSENVLTSEDVIRGFMRHEAGSSEADVNQGAEVDDAETHALVEATLKAFERELLGPATTASSSSQRKPSSNKKSTKVSTSGPSKKKKSSAKKRAEASKGSFLNEVEVVPMDHSAEPSQEPAKKEKKKKKRKSGRTTDTSKDKYDDDEFSRALADMVNQVVNTSLADAGPQVAETPKLRKEHAPFVASSEAQTKVANDQNDQNDDTFDLNQIMQKAMAMAFQEQTQEGIDTSVMEDFNRGLGDFGVSDILTPTVVSPKKKRSEKSALNKHLSKREKANKEFAKNLVTGGPAQTVSKSKSKKAKPEKLQPSSEELLRKQYSLTAKAAASAARKLITEKNRANKAQLKMERRMAREEKKQVKKVEEEKLVAERKELEDIVAKGPPYPPDLRLTKSGKPKKPYRRMTKEEMEKRASIPSEDIKTKKVKKPKKKKLKKLKRIPLSTLRKIPLFNFVKNNIPAGVRQKLNGIDDTLKKIPLQSYKLDINKLAPPEKVSKEEMELYKITGDNEDTANRLRRAALSASFDVSRKTVIRREKIPFHPPWDIPTQPPFALPVARRRRKERSRRSKEDTRGSDNKRHTRDSSVVFNARNKIIPAVLFPIINTLKAAAKAKAASGASSEEASRHLMTIIRHTKKSIAQTLASSRRHSRTDYSTIKTESDIQRSQEREQRLKRIPIFSLANIREIETREKNHLQALQQRNTTCPSVIKIEEDEIPTREFIDLEILQDSPHAATTCNSDTLPLNKDENNISKREEALLRVQNNEDKNASNSSAAITEGLTKIDSISQSSTVAPFPKTSDAINKEPASNIEIAQGVESSEKGPRNNKMEVSSIKRELEDEVPASPKLEDDSNGEQKVRNVLEILMKQQLSQSHKDSVDLPSNFQNIITATIGELIPSLEEESFQEKNRELANRKRPRKGPPQVLNLDGLVPPSAQLIRKIEEKKLPDAQSSVQSRAGNNRKKIEQSTPSYVFNIPDPKVTQGKRIMLLKRAKRHLSNEEMNVLKKEMNKERKRKWREANVEKNWENDLRARLRRRANGKFGDTESAEKETWFADELAKSLADRGTKRENDNALKKANGSTNLGDAEVLNMIATTLNKLDVARMLERELNEDIHKRFDNVTRKSNKSTIELAFSPTQPSASNGGHDASEGAGPSYLEEGRPSEDKADEFNEDGTLKRPYPDDISVDVPVLKRPRFLSVNENDQ